MKQDKKYTEIMKQLNYKPIGSVLLRLYGVVARFFKLTIIFVLSLNFGILVGKGLMYLLDKLGLADNLFRFMEAITIL